MFVQDEWRRGRLSLDAGVRVDKTWIDIGYEQIGTRRVRIENEEMYPVYAVALGARWDFSPAVGIFGRTRLSTQNAPTVETVPGGSLSSSTRMGFETGIDTTFTSWFRPRLCVYYLDVRDAPFIAGQSVNKDDPTDIINLYNSLDWHEYGAELALAGSWNAWSYQLSGSWNNKNDNTLDNRIPEFTFNGVVRYRQGPWLATFGVYCIDSFEAVNKAGTGDAEGYTNIDAAISRDFSIHGLATTLTFYVRNLTDDDYESVYGFPSMGRIVGAGARMMF